MGATTIRSYKKEEEFVARNFNLQNKNILSKQIERGVGGWIGIRCDLLALFVVGISCSFCIVFKDQVNPIMLALLLTYVITLSDLMMVI